MKGLMLKEFYTLRQYWKMYSIYVILFGGISVATGQVGFSAAMMAMIVFTLPLSTFTIDEQCSWGRMAIAMPLSRKQIVRSKYLVTLLMGALCLAIQLVTLLAAYLLGKDSIDIVVFFTGMLVSMLSMFVMMMIVMPFIFRFGSEKGRIAMMLAVGVLFVAIMVVAFTAKQSEAASPDFSIEALPLMLMVGAVAVVGAVASYVISCRIYARKEF